MENKVKKTYDPEYQKQRKAKWYQENKEISINRAKEWKKNNAEHVKEYNHMKNECDNCGKATTQTIRHKKSKKCQKHKAN